ncbi:MAG: recombinase family protein [Candidatus Aureabacteria bacterium]|nr:recombinase family protein [Candidatus Auribacterota bacterium]MCK5161215.1 recombinase family protein [Candidatus Auribacterota bacterium]
MKVAIYARYSSENQSEKSIDDQIRVCKKYIKENKMTVEERHIYIDEAISGSIVNRPALQALEKAAENKEFDAVAVDDLSRLSRSNHQMLTLVMKFNYLQIKLISVSDGIITDDENSKLGIHIRGFINELYLDDLKKKTMRGLEGQKLRGFSTGENVYGYSSHPFGELKLNKKGNPKYEGMVHKINPDEADIVKRIFKEFIEGKSINRIVRDLNSDKTPTKKGYIGGWNISTVSRILKNEKYMGLWVWRKWKNVRDPMTGKVKKVPRAEKEQMPVFKEDLVIIDKETWEKAQKRWQELEGAWPVRKKSNIKQKSYVKASPTHLLAGLLKCNSCGGAVVLVGGKGSGYYGCYNAKRKTCDNTLLVPRNRVEQTIISELKGKILTHQNLECVYKKLEKLVSKGLNKTPELIKKKKSQHDKVFLEIQNYLNYIKVGNFSSAVSEALKEAESKSKTLKDELKSLEYQKDNTFKSPPKEWINHRLDRLHETLSKNTTSSALALKEILGTIKLEPVTDKNSDFYYIVSNGEKKFKPSYVAHTKIQTLALLDEKHKGSNWLQWRRR